MNKHRENIPFEHLSTPPLQTSNNNESSSDDSASGTMCASLVSSALCHRFTGQRGITALWYHLGVVPLCNFVAKSLVLEFFPAFLDSRRHHLCYYGGVISVFDCFAREYLPSCLLRQIPYGVSAQVALWSIWSFRRFSIFSSSSLFVRVAEPTPIRPEWCVSMYSISSLRSRTFQPLPSERPRDLIV